MSTATLEPPVRPAPVRVPPDISAPVPDASRFVSVAEYLRHDEAAMRRSEYIAGEIVPMAGASRIHVRISKNMVYELEKQLIERDCDVFFSETRVRAGLRYYYPDVGVVCGEYIVDDASGRTLTNPGVIIEVLSDSTAHVDRGVKLRDYRRLPSLRTYLLVSQDFARIEQYERGDDGEWRYREIEGLDSAVHLPAVDCVLPMAAIYRRVEVSPLAELDAMGSDDER